MTRNYQQEGYGRRAYNQMPGSEAEESVNRDEYRDLYDPFKIKWKSVLGHVGAEAAEPVLKNSKGYAVSMSKEPVSSYPYGRRVANSPYPDEPRRESFNPFETPYRGKIRSSSTWQKHAAQTRENFSASGRVKTELDTSETAFTPGNTYRHFTTGYGPRD